MNLKNITLTAFVLINVVDIYAQKLPHTQQGSIWATNIKIDGKLDDWGSNLQAYNKETQLWHSIANDGEYLYLAVKKDKNPGKVTGAPGALKFFVNVKNKKDTTDLPAITFPVNTNGHKYISDENWNEMLVQNIEGISEKKISILNQYGIMVGWQLEKEGKKPLLYTYELAIPLKLLKTKPETTITYHILLRGTNAAKPYAAEQIHNMAYNTIAHPQTPISDDARANMAEGMRWTSLTAKYKLAIKPN